MAQGFPSRLDASEHREPSSVPTARDKQLTPADDASFAKILQALSTCGEGSVATELALDLVLNELVQRACAETNASSGAIALLREGEMVCRAASGEGAPGLGIRLDAKPGLSAECLRTGTEQCCLDAQTDPRVDATRCQQLGISSIAVVPVLVQNKLIGILEVFSPAPHAFGERHLEILRGISREIAGNVERASGVQTPEMKAEALSRSDSQDSAQVNSLEPLSMPRKRDVLSDLLLGVLVLISIALGWILGINGWWHSHRARPAPSRSQGLQSQAVTSPSTAESGPTNYKITNPQTSATGAGTIEEEPAGDGLIITRNGKVVYRSAGAGKTGSRSNAPGADAAAPILSPAMAEGYLISRVDPVYPDAAKTQGVQGPVVFDALIGEDGTVRRLTLISGDPILVVSAAQAAQQWKFRPFLHNGVPQQFRTRLTVIFKAS